MILKILLLIFIIPIVNNKVIAQSVTDTSINIPMFAFHYSFHIPAGDMAKRFGNSNSVGGDFTYKLKNNFIFGIDYSFIFGEKILNKDNYFHNIIGKSGYVIDGNGMMAEVFLYERGYNISAIIGKQFNIWNLNPNSGPFIQLHTGFLQHYVRIENAYKTAPQVHGDYAKLYDRLTNGLSLTEFVGYRFMGNKRLWNFYAGFEFMQAFTKNRRSFNADDMAPEAFKRLDMLNGFRFGWIVPLYGKTRSEFYYN